MTRIRHGGDPGEAAARHGGRASDWLDLSTGINPNPWPVPPDLREAGWTRLPAQGDLDALLAAAREAYGVPPGADIVAAPGTQALIGWLPRLAPPGPVAIVGPTYAEHAAAWRGAGRKVEPIGSLAELRPDHRHLVVVNPNNPDGRIAPVASLLDVAGTCARRGGWLVVDEAFADVQPECSVAFACADHPVVVLRSFGKFYGLAGLRLGFALARPGIAEPILEALGPWAVSGPALAVGARALADRAWASAARDRLAEASRALDDTLRYAGLTILGGTSLFRLTRHPAAAALHEALAARQIWTRAFDHAPDLLRFGLPPDRASAGRLGRALRDALRGLPGYDHGTTT